MDETRRTSQVEEREEEMKKKARETVSIREKARLSLTDVKDIINDKMINSSSGNVMILFHSGSGSNSGTRQAASRFDSTQRGALTRKKSSRNSQVVRDAHKVSKSGARSGLRLWGFYTPNWRRQPSCSALHHHPSSSGCIWSHPEQH